MIHDFEQLVQRNLHQYLLAADEVDQRLPDASDIEEQWEAIAQAFMPDGIREYTDYPVVTLGWMMYVGMAVAKMWDEDWEHATALPNIYEHLRDARGFDLLDEYVREEVLGLQRVEISEAARSAEPYAVTERLVGECAARTQSQLLHSGYEAGTRDAFHAFTACLHQLYLMGAAVQLKRMGYHMVEMKK